MNINLSKEFNELLKQFYINNHDTKEPRIPLELIKEYLEIEGIKIENNEKQEKKDAN